VKKKPGGGVSEWLFAGASRTRGWPRRAGGARRATFHPDVKRHVLCVAGAAASAGMMSILSRPAVRSISWLGRSRLFGVRTARDGFFLDELQAFRTVPAGWP